MIHPRVADVSRTRANSRAPRTTANSTIASPPTTTGIHRCGSR